MKIRIVRAGFVCCALAVGFVGTYVKQAAADVTITVQSGTDRQTMEGFGATTVSRANLGVDQLGAMRSQVLNAIYNEVNLNMGDIHCGPYEGYLADTNLPPSWTNLIKSNDNDDPNSFNWERFHWSRSNAAKTNLVDIAGPMGLDNFCLSGRVSTRWADQWLYQLRDSVGYTQYLAEAAENAVAVLVRWRDEYGIVPEWHQPFNEPLSGNRELWGGNVTEVVDLIKTIGARFRKEGFDKIKMITPSEETEEKSLNTATAIMNDPEARQYVGAIAFHPYPYGSTYAKAANILGTSGSGNPSASRISVRNAIRDLAAQHGVQVWMTEVSHSEAGEWDTFRARAIHIHDELKYADCSAYWGMMNMYDAREASEEDHVLVFDGPAQTYEIQGMGYAIGHYARWTERGNVRVVSTSSDPLIQITAFRDDARLRMVLVLINNASSERIVDVDIQDGATAQEISGGLRRAREVGQNGHQAAVIGRAVDSKRWHSTV